MPPSLRRHENPSLQVCSPGVVSLRQPISLLVSIFLLLHERGVLAFGSVLLVAASEAATLG